MIKYVYSNIFIIIYVYILVRIRINSKGFFLIAFTAYWLKIGVVPFRVIQKLK